MMRKHKPIAVAVAAALAGAAHAAPDNATPDTSQWKCQTCPFLEGYSSTVEAGVQYVNGADARYGRYTGVDHNGVYADAGAQGQWRDAKGTFLNYQATNAGLPARAGSIEGGREGLFELQLGYDGQPTRLYDTPKLEYDRRTVSLLGSFFAAKSWTVYAQAGHQEKVGSGLTSGSFLTEALQLAQPLDYKTNTLETGVRWTNAKASFHLAYSGSWFADGTDALIFANPYPPIVPGSTRGQLALPPGNELQQVSAGGDWHLPVLTATILTYEASIGKLTQDQAFLPVSTLAASPALAASSLDGNVHLSHYALALSSQPITHAYVRGKASYDGRDDHTSPLSIPYVVTDTFPGGTYTTPRYSEDRTRLEGSADYRLLRWLRVGVAGEALYTHYSPGQVVASTQNNRGWGQITATPLADFTLTAKAGNARRKTGTQQNPLLITYNYAPRDQNFFSISSSWSVTNTLTWGLEGGWADDAYRLSTLGLQNVRERRLASTVTWAPTEHVSFYADSSYQRLAMLQNGSLAPHAPAWQALDGEYYWSSGVGGRWQLHERWDLNLDYTHATTRGNNSVTSGGIPSAQFFPENRSQLDSLALRATYRWSKALRLRFRYAHERYDSNDWALDGVGPTSVPDLLSLGLQPYRYRVNAFALTAIYQLGEREVAVKE